MEYLLFTCFIVSFLVVYSVTPFWIRRAKTSGLVGKDIHKPGNTTIPELGGLCVLIGFITGILTYIAISTFYFDSLGRSLQVMAVLSSILIVALIGIVDDLLGWKIGLRQWQKPLLVLFAALPIVVINAGYSIVYLPFFGPTDFGILYPLILIPLAITGAANGFNLIEGYNGLGTGQGIIILATQGIAAWLLNNTWVSVIAFSMVFALLAFYAYNKYPARVFPGDTLTYSVGALIAIIAILGNIEKISLILFTPYFIELVLKARGKMKKESFAHLNKDGTLDNQYNKYYGIEHVTIDLIKKIKGKAYETEVVHTIHAFQILLAIIALLTL